MIVICEFYFSDGITWNCIEIVPVECESLEEVYVAFEDAPRNEWGNKQFMGREFDKESGARFFTLAGWVKENKEGLYD